MNKVNLTILHPVDLAGAKVGGIETFIKGFIKYAPDDFCIEFLGTTSAPNIRPVQKWHEATIGNKKFRVFPVLREKYENKNNPIPLSLRFTLRLKLTQLDFKNRILFFHRIEPALFFNKSLPPKIIITHVDITKCFNRKESEILWSKFPWGYHLLEKLIFSSAEHIYSVSEETIRFYKSRYAAWEDKFSFWPTSVDTSIFFPRSEDKSSLKKIISDQHPFLCPNHKWILFAGRLQKAKAPLRVIDAFAEYHKKNNEATLIMIGAGNLKEDILRHVKDLNLSQNVFLLGAQEQDVLKNFYQAADTLLLASHFEGMPICVLEALACGLPVVTTNVGEVNLLVKEDFSGIITDDASPLTIAAAIERVLTHPDRYSQENCLKAVEEYSTEEIFGPVYEKFRALYQETLRPHQNEGAPSTPEENNRTEILDVQYDNLTMNQSVQSALGLLAQNKKSNIFFLNADCLYKTQHDLDYKKVLSKADLVLPDGIGLKIATRIFGKNMKDNCNGSDFSPLLMKGAAQKNYSVFFLGSQPGVAAKAADVAKSFAPDIKIAGTHSGYFDDDDDVINGINASGADILFVALGVPLQEKWICQHRDRLNPKLCLGIGALFDYLSGNVTRAPKAVQAIHLEWLWRIFMEPQRLWKRYIIDGAKFFGLVFKKKFSDKKK